MWQGILYVKFNPNDPTRIAFKRLILILDNSLTSNGVFVARQVPITIKILTPTSGTTVLYDHDLVYKTHSPTHLGISETLFRLYARNNIKE